MLRTRPIASRRAPSRRTFLVAAAAVLLASAFAIPAVPRAEVKAGKDLMYLDLGYGRVVIRMRPDLAPKHVARITELARQGFYDGIVFHRVIEGFMAQTGDPTGTGRGGSGKKLKAEFSSARFERGIVGMARSGHPDSADSQFFIMFKPAPQLNGGYTVWGEVVAGMDFVDRLKRGQPPANPDRIVRMRPAADSGD